MGSSEASTTTEETTVSGFDRGAHAYLEANESLEDEEEDDNVDTLPSIKINSTW
jgi:hypothetical protein